MDARRTVRRRQPHGPRPSSRRPATRRRRRDLRPQLRRVLHRAPGLHADRPLRRARQLAPRGRRGRLHSEGLRRTGVHRRCRRRRPVPARRLRGRASGRGLFRRRRFDRRVPRFRRTGCRAVRGASRRARHRRRHELHLGNHRQPQGRQARPCAAGNLAGRRLCADDDLPQHVRHPARGRQRSYLRLAPLPHGAAHPLDDRVARRPRRRVDGQVGARRDAAADRQVPLHHLSHGSHAVQPPAAPARRRAREVRGR